MYGSKFVAARTCVEQIIDLCCTLCYLDVPIHHKSYMFGDNKTVVDSFTIPNSKLHTCHTVLSYHHVHDAIVSGIVAFYHLAGEINLVDILSKH